MTPLRQATGTPPYKAATIPAVEISPVTCGLNGSGVGLPVCADIILWMPGTGQTNVRNELFVMMPGSEGNPGRHDEVLQSAALAGYFALGLSYNNNTTVFSECVGENECALPSASYTSECQYSVRRERIEGVNSPFSAWVPVPEDTVLTRLVLAIRKLAWMDINGFLGGANNDFFFNDWCGTGNNDVFTLPEYLPNGMYGWSHMDLSNTVIAGFSQGGGVAGYISYHELVDGLVLLDSAEDRCCPTGGDCADLSDTLLSKWYVDRPNLSVDEGKFGSLHEVTNNIWLPLQSFLYLGFDGTAPIQSWMYHTSVDGTLSTDVEIIKTLQAAGGSDHASMAGDCCIPPGSTGGGNEPEATFYNSHLAAAYVAGFCRAGED